MVRHEHARVKIRLRTNYDFINFQCFGFCFFPQPLAGLLRHRARNRADKGCPSIKPAKNGHATGQTKRKQHQYNSCRSKCGKSTKGVNSPRKTAHSKAKQKRRHCEKNIKTRCPGGKPADVISLPFTTEPNPLPQKFQLRFLRSCSHWILGTGHLGARKCM